MPDNEEVLGIKISALPAATEAGSSDVFAGVQGGRTKKFPLAVIVSALRSGLSSLFVPLTRKVNNKPLSSDITLDASDVPYDSTSSSLNATDVQEAIDELAAGAGGSTAATTTYDNTDSGLSASNVQDALDEIVDDLDGKADESTIAPRETSATASSAHPLGSIFYLNGVLYRALSDIAIGETINTGSGGNATQTTVAANFSRIVKLTSAQYAQLSAAEKAADIVYIVTDSFVTPADIGAAPDTAGVYYGVCSTTNSTQAKEVSITGITSLYEGLHIQVRFTQSQNYDGTPTLNVNSLGAKDIYSSGSYPAVKGEWRANSVLDLVYDGTRWRIVNGTHAEGSIYGIVKLNAAVNSTATDEAATPSAVKSAYDLANGKYSKPAGGIPAADLASGVIPAVPAISTSTPQMDGTGAAGSTGETSDAGHVHPRYTGPFSSEQIFSTVTDISSDTTITLAENYEDYKLLVFVFNTRSADAQSYRAMLTLPPSAIGLWGSYAVASRECNGFVRVVPVNNQPKQIRFALTDVSPLYITAIYGIK